MTEQDHRPRRSTAGRRQGHLLGTALLCLLGGTLACSTTVPMPYPAGFAEENYVLGAPDELLLTILPEPIIERTVTVRPDGMISVDLIGDVLATGRRVEEVAAEIQKRISRYKRDARATLALVIARSNQVTVFGEVQAPGTFELVRDTRVADAIGLRGGGTIFASKRKIRVIRSDGETAKVMIVDLKDIQAGDLSTNIMLAGGDIVMVPPTALAKVGYALKSVLFPFQQILSASVGTIPFAALFI